MNKAFITTTFISIFLILTNSACVEQKVSSEVRTEKPALSSPADVEIAEAGKIINQYPNLAKNYNRLAFAFLKKVRETGDYSLNRQAESALKKSLEIEPDNYEAMVLQVQILLSDHRFEEGLELAQKLETVRPSDLAIYVAKTDALTELGRYKEAVEAAQKAVNLRPNAVSYARVANLRFLYGDTEGALEMRKLAVKIADPDDKEFVAWNHVELGNVLYNTGKFDEAMNQYDSALESFPNYYLALAAKGRTFAAKNDDENAIKFFQLSQTRVPLPETVIALGDVFADRKSVV